MTKISAEYMMFEKALAPVIFLGLAAMLAVAVSMKTPLKHGQWMLTILPFVATGVGVIITKHFWTYMDEVYDCGDYLLARRGSEEAAISLADVLSIDELRGRGIAIHLLLARNSHFGREVKFVPRRRGFVRPLDRSALYLDLAERIAAAKAKRPSNSTADTRTI